ncbi:hypothetical protein BD560DRAFT_492037 [Blakeslea trispora]|nr:hypothetical protein BD560DRAFT_492037 [Blakeslea trispora]
MPVSCLSNSKIMSAFSGPSIEKKSYLAMPVVVPFFTGAKQLAIDLAEPVIILRGGSKDKITHVLQGEVNLVLTKPILASQVVIQFVGKSHTLWPEGIGARGTKIYHEKVIHEQNLLLQSFTQNPKQEGTLAAGIHRWPFEFLLSNQLAETIEDELGKVFYYVTATVHRVGVGMTKLKSRRDILLLRTPNWSDNALTANSLPSTSITSERRMEACDAMICIEKSMVSSGTQFPIILSVTPNIKNVFIESVSFILQEKRVYKVPEYQARRVEMNDFKVPLFDLQNLVDPDLLNTTTASLSLKDMKRVLGVKNAHISLNDGPFQYRLVFNLPNCVQLNHSSTFPEIHISHTLRLHIELSSPSRSTCEEIKSNIHLETPITILDCRLKEDYNALPTYKEALLVDSVVNEQDIATSKPTGFFHCPCYLEYQKKRNCTRRDWIKTRCQPSEDNENVPPPTYESINLKDSYPKLT